MKIGKMTILVVFALALTFFAGIAFYSSMPEHMATHWNSKGQVDGWMHKSGGMFIVPAIALFTVLLLYGVLLVDPLRKNIRKFMVYYEGLILSLAVFLLAAHLFVIAWNLGAKFSMNVFMPLAMGSLFFAIGAVLPNLRPNWFMGIRTPWTLSDEAVWVQTHRVGGPVFKAAAVVVLFGAVWPAHALWFVVLPVLGASLFAVFYSLHLYRKPRKC